MEIAAFSVESAIIAANAGAGRIELCANGYLGGTTPSITDFTILRKTLREKGIGIPINVMIRPRGGDFVFSKEEVEVMVGEIEEFMGLRLGNGEGPDGFVFGLLTERGSVDIEGCKRLLALAGGRGCTFHRAFDSILSSNREKAVQDILDLGFKAILTSGSASDAVGGKEVLADLVKRVEGSGCEIIVGGGVRSSNLEGLKGVVGARWWHSSADVKGEGAADEDEVERLVMMTGRG